MITVTRLNGTKLTINAMLIETMEQTPDTVITLTTGRKFVVLEKVPEVTGMVQTYLRTIGIAGSIMKREDSEGLD